MFSHFNANTGKISQGNGKQDQQGNNNKVFADLAMSMLGTLNYEKLKNFQKQIM